MSFSFGEQKTNETEKKKLSWQPTIWKPYFNIQSNFLLHFRLCIYTHITSIYVFKCVIVVPDRTFISNIIIMHWVSNRQFQYAYKQMLIKLQSNGWLHAAFFSLHRSQNSSCLTLSNTQRERKKLTAKLSTHQLPHTQLHILKTSSRAHIKLYKTFSELKACKCIESMWKLLFNGLIVIYIVCSTYVLLIFPLISCVCRVCNVVTTENNVLKSNGAVYQMVVVSIFVLTICCCTPANVKRFAPETILSVGSFSVRFVFSAFACCFCWWCFCYFWYWYLVYSNWIWLSNKKF